MKKLFILILFSTTLSYSQQTITNSLGDFHTIKTYRGLVVELIKSDKNSIEIKGDKSSSVVVKNVNEILKISMQVLETFSYDDVIIKIFYANNLKHLSANEGSKIYSDEMIKQDKINLKATEGAIINLNIEVNQLEVKSYTSGKIILEGKATNQNIKANTGGTYVAPELKTQYTTVSTSTGGEATVFATIKVDASASLGGVVTINGDPKESTQKETVGGYIRKN